MNCSDVIVAYLEAAGIDCVFGYPGDPSVEFLEALRRRSMDFVLATREGTAGLMAEAYGQLTGLPGVCLSTLGPGSSNLVNAVANAYLDRVPMIALSGQIENKRRATFTHQVLDHGQLFGSISKWTATISPQDVGVVMRKALRTAMAERPGPVHLSTPADVVGAPAVDAEVRAPPLRASSEGIEIFGAPGAADPVKAIAAARRPIILAGMSALRNGAGAATTRLAERLGCPVVVAPMAKGVVSEDHPCFAGVLDMACNALLWDFLGQADLLLNIGFDAVELIKPWSAQAPVIHVDTTPNTDQIYFAGIEVVGPLPRAVEALADAVSSDAPRWSSAELAAHRDRLRAAYLAGRVHGRLNPTDVVEAVRAASPDDAIATTDVGSHKLLVGQGWTTRFPRGMLMSNGLSSMGFSLPAAMVASRQHPDREVVCFTGDGGLAMVQSELRLAATLGLGPTVVVFCDDSLNRIELKQAARQYPSFGTRIEATDIPRLAESMGCDGIGVETQSALEGALAARRGRADRPLVIAARIDPAQYQSQF